MQTSRMIEKALEDLCHNLEKNHLQEPRPQDRIFIESLFSKYVRHIPKGMVSEVFEYGWQAFLSGSKLVLPELCDVLLMEYDEESALLNTEDWIFLCDVVNEHATQMDMELVQSIMKLVVENDALV